MAENVPWLAKTNAPNMVLLKVKINALDYDGIGVSFDSLTLNASSY